MPSKSKQQQKFMGIVRAIQKGDEPASKFSKDAQDAADDMKKKDVEDFASTKHKGLPKKVEQALREKIRTMVEDYVESCGYVVSAKDPNYKLKSPGGTGEEDRELKENAGVPNKMRAGFKKLKNKEGLSIEERDELYKVYKGIVELMTYGNFYDNKKPNKKRKELSELTFDINYALVGSKRLGSYQGRFEKILKKFLNMINTQIKREEKGLKTDYRKAMRASKLDDVKNIFKNVTKYARTQKGIQKGTNEGFGSDEFLTKTEKKKFEKERLENAEVLGYELTGKKDIKEAITGSARKNLLKIGKEIKNNLFRINPGLKKVKDNRLLIRGLANTFMFMRYTPDNANYQNYKKYFPKNFKSSSVQKLANILQKEKDTVRATFFKQVVKENESKKESVFAVRQDKIKNGERFPKEPNFDYDPEKGKSRIRKVNENLRPSDRKVLMVIGRDFVQWINSKFKHGLGKKEIRGLKQTLPNILSVLGRPEDKRYNKFKSSMKHSPIRKYNDKLLARLSKGFDSEPTNIKRKFVDELIKYSLKESINEARLNPKETIKQLGGNRFLYMVGAKNLAIDKPRNELHMKIMRNAKGVSHVVIKLTSLDLYDMKFLSIRAGKIRVKATEKGVYGDQLATFFKKHTGLNTRL